MGILTVLNIFSEVPQWIVTRTISLWVCYFSIALTDSVRGPTLLDVRDIVGISTQEMSYTFMFAAMGGLCGCLTVGVALDRVRTSTKYLVLFASAVMVALLSSTFPYSTNLYSILGNSILFGFFNGTFHTCGNVLFLQIWKGRQSCPHLFAMHFCFGIGSLLSPILAKPFLREAVEDQIVVSTEPTDLPIIHQSSEVWTVKILYPLIGVQLVLLVTPLLVFYIKERARERSEVKKLDAGRTEKPGEMEEEPEEPVKEELDNLTTSNKVFLMFLMFVMYFCFAGIEISFRSYISTFTVSMGYTRQDGSDVTALFYLSFTIVRGMSVVGGIFVSPASIMWASQIICLGGSVLLSALSAHYFLAIQLGVVCMGAGTACLFAAGLLWLKDVLTISNKIGATLTIGMNISVQVYCVLIGYIIEDNPMKFMTMMTATSTALIIIFSIITILVKYFQSSSKPVSRI